MTTAFTETTPTTVLPSPLALVEEYAEQQSQGAPVPAPTVAPRPSPTVVLDGFSVSITVRAGHLVLKAEGCEVKLPRAHHGVQRVLVLSQAGFISLQAMRWARENGVALIGLSPYSGDPTFSAAIQTHDDPRLLRAQAALPAAAQLAIALRVIGDRISGQLTNLARNFPDAGAARERVERAASALSEATTVRQVQTAEASAAKGYWAAWSGLPIRWATKDRDRIPDRWLTFPGRQTGRGGGARYSTHPVNSLVNYANAVAERLAVVACQSVGLHPDLGVLHSDAAGSPGMALDVLEAARGAVEATVLEMVAGTVLTRADFHEVRQGEVILREGPTAVLGQASAAWTTVLGHTAEDVAAIVGQASAGKVIPRTPLTARRNHERVASGSSRRVAAPPPVLAGR